MKVCLFTQLLVDVKSSDDLTELEAPSMFRFGFRNMFNCKFQFKFYFAYRPLFLHKIHGKVLQQSGLL